MDLLRPEGVRGLALYAADFRGLSLPPGGVYDEAMLVNNGERVRGMWGTNEIEAQAES